MELGLYQTQSMKLVMTQELRQAITILQYPTLELTQFIQQQASENPLIELQENKLGKKTTEAKFQKPERDSWFSNEDDDVNPINFLKSEDFSLHAHLIEQLSWMNLSKEEKSIAEYIIFCLDENGFLDCTLDCLQEELQITVEKAEGLLYRIQQMEPVGVGARSLSECLLLQYDESNQNIPAVREILMHHLESFANKKWHQLVKTLGVSMEELHKAEACIRSLNPRPCAAFHKHRVEWVQPEFFIVRNNDEELTIQVNEELIPEITLNERYFRILQHHSEAKSYLDGQLQKYQWLKRSLSQRKQTLQKLGEYLLHAQREFFEKGYEALRPMTLKEVAKQIDVHESTISRAVKNKSIQTPRGTIPLKSLFTSRLENENQSKETSSTQVKLQIQRYIEEEEKRKPLSDQKIADKLKGEGIEISRRTVAKYREALRIPSSSKRKSIVV